MKKAFLDIDELSVPQSLLELARAGSGEAKQRLTATVGSMILSHRLNEMDDDSAVVSVRELRQLGIIKKLIVYA